MLSRISLIGLAIVTLAAACLTHVNIFEIMFHPYPAPAFGNADAAKVDPDDKVVAVTIARESRAYPIRIMGYHHIVNDSVGGVPIAVTYCTLCHAGLVWNRLLDGRTLRFRLAGINNGNALMRDEETQSIWQQSTGQAIFGPQKGKQLELIHSDELTFGIWRGEYPRGLVLKADEPYAADYESKDWEKHIESTPVVIDTRKSGIAPHELMLGITLFGTSKAYPVKAILGAKLIQDRIADNPIQIIVGPDGASIRVFHADILGRPMTLVPVESASQPAKDEMMQDAETGSVWNFQGCALRGELAGQCLKPVDASKDYWFDWMNHHPSTLVFRN
jgi:hypothetical protein